MTVTYGFYDSLSGDRKYNALQLSRLFKGIITDGIFQSIGQGFVVGAPGLMTVSVGSGRGWFNDRWIDNDAAIQLTVLASEAVLPRIDTVVIEINSDIGTRANALKVIKGTPASSPVPPTMANTSTLHQYPLADISIPANDTDITPGQITNRIGMAGGTPFITGILTSFDVSTLFGQFESNFDAWFANLQNQLDANQAANLQNQIDALVAQNYGWIPVSDTWTYLSVNSVGVPSDATLKYHRFMKVRFKQGGAYKYFYANVINPTSLDLLAGNVYSVANAPITDISYSFSQDAVGFPLSFSFNVNAGGFSSLTQQTGWFTISGGVFTGFVDIGGTSNSTVFNFVSPIPITTYLIALWVYQPTTSVNPALLEPAGGNLVTIYKNAALDGWTPSGVKRVIGTFTFPIL